ncbi:MAG: glycosyltransferase family 2 protein [Planctomycetota bacterium]
MKLVIQIPCYNEEKTLRGTLDALPKRIPGVGEIEYLVIDDGSTDRTAQVAREWGVQHIVRFPQNRGLARAFEAGLDAALRVGADIIVNTDADNQYCAADIQRLVGPILDGAADIVVGERPIDKHEEFSWLKKRLQWIGSWVVRRASGTDIPDAPSGFRAHSRDAALRLTVLSNYTYTLETIIQAGRKNLAITSVPVRTNPSTRPSRLVKSLWSYVTQSAGTILRIFVVYEPLKFFFTLGAIVFGLGFLIGVRFVYFYIAGTGSGHVQSLILAAVLLMMGFQLGVLGLVAELIASNRKLIDETLYRVRRIEASGGAERNGRRDG